MNTFHAFKQWGIISMLGAYLSIIIILLLFLVTSVDSFMWSCPAEQQYTQNNSGSTRKYMYTCQKVLLIQSTVVVILPNNTLKI